eukprot:TRINITY_DN25719_c0_g1_i3.p1 TRINITY_DN25719_c0_g1~~TRINITY_DN25719_c0_g1_i3.p1  ORF type:complete len:303 (+),score=66.90 TRINITY_DN25719_c0_g1_i3:117-1025(+)
MADTCGEVFSASETSGTDGAAIGPAISGPAAPVDTAAVAASATDEPNASDAGSFIVVDEVVLETASHQSSGTCGGNDLGRRLGEKLAISSAASVGDSGDFELVADPAGTRQSASVADQTSAGVSSKQTPTPQAPLFRGCDDPAQRTPVSAAAVAEQRKRKVQQVLRLFTKSGNVKLDDALKVATGISASLARSWAAEEWGDPTSTFVPTAARQRRQRCLPPSSVIATALTLAHVQRSYPEERPNWEAKALEAVAWLEACKAEWSGAAAGNVEELVSAAATQLRWQNQRPILETGDWSSDDDW